MKGDSMTEQSVESAVPEWNPLAKREIVRHPLKVSGGRAAVLLRRWSGRERLAYEDALTERMMQLDSSGEETVRIGTLRLFAATLTIVGSEGFPVELDERDGRAFLTGTREQIEADLLSITDTTTLDEIRKAATDVQPLPSAAGDDQDDEDDESNLPDPSSTSRTPPTPTADVDA